MRSEDSIVEGIDLLFCSDTYLEDISMNFDHCALIEVMYEMQIAKDFSWIKFFCNARKSPHIYKFSENIELKKWLAPMATKLLWEIW